MTRRLIASGSAYEDLIGYSRAVVVPGGDGDGWIFVSGCTGTDPVTMALPASVEGQCAAALATIARALNDGGATFADVVRVRYILPDAAEFAFKVVATPEAAPAEAPLQLAIAFQVNKKDYPMPALPLSIKLTK